MDTLGVYGKRKVKYGGRDMEMFYSPLGVKCDEITKTTDGALVVPGVASAKTVDRTDEVVLPGSFKKHLAEYKRNPLVTFQHDIFYPVGKAVKVRITDFGLEVVDELLYLPTDQLMNYLYAAVEQRVLRTMSIGFVPVEWEDSNATNIRTYTENILVEHAIVSYPANMDAEIGDDVTRRSLMDLEDDEGKLAKLAYATGMLAGSIKGDGRTLSKDNTPLVEEVMGLLATAQRNLGALIEPEKKEPELDLDALDEVVSNLKDAIGGEQE